MLNKVGQKLGRSPSIVHTSNNTAEPSRTSVSERPKGMLDKLIKQKEKKVEQHVTLETILNIAQDFEHFDQTILNQLSPNSIYTTGNDIGDIKIFTHYNESQISCIDGDTVDLNLCVADSFRKIKLNKLRLMHMGLVIIGIKPLVRSGLGTKALIAVLDKRWTGSSSKASLGMIEADTSGKGGLFYCAPDLLLNSEEFFKKIKIGIMTRGYEDLEQGSKNLLICTYFIGKLMQVKTPKYNIDIKDLSALAASTSIKLLEPYKVDSRLYAGQEWDITKFNIGKPNQTQLTPSSGQHYIDSNGKETVRFSDFEEVVEDENE